MDKLNPNTKRSFGAISGAVVFLFLTLFLGKAIHSTEVRFIESPKPTHVEKNFKKLIKVKEITGEIDDAHFLALPINLTADGKGNIFLYDRVLVKIFKLDKNLRYVTDFGKTGRGPGDISNPNRSSHNIYFAKDNHLYFHCPGNRKIMRFNDDGKLQNEIRKNGNVSVQSSQPVIDKHGNIYMLSMLDSNAVVIRYDSSYKRTGSFLTHEDMKEFIVLKPFPSILASRSLPGVFNTFYDVFGEDGLIVYLANSSTAYIFKGTKLVRKFRIWPKNAIEVYKRGIEAERERDKKYKSEKTWFIHFISSFFVDKDDEKHFYIDCYGKKDMATLYKFDLEGNLICILTHKAKGTFQAKRNNRFYGLDMSSSRIFVYKEETK